MYFIYYAPYLFKKRLWLVLQCGWYWSRCTDENYVKCLHATQFVMYEEVGQTDTWTWLDEIYVKFKF